MNISNINLKLISYHFKFKYLDTVEYIVKCRYICTNIFEFCAGKNGFISALIIVDHYMSKEAIFLTINYYNRMGKIATEITLFAEIIVKLYC